jgi:uncharacterized membrane protein
MSALLALLRLLDSGICAQLPTHMLMPGGEALPLCARNTGIYTGAVLAFGVLRLQGRQRAMLPPPPPLVGLLLAVVGVMGVDGLNSVAADLGLPHLYPPSNALRLATGLGAGVALALLLAPVIARARHGDADQRPPVDRPVALLPFAIPALAGFPVIWSQAPWTLYPVAIISNAGLFLTLAGLTTIAVHAGRGIGGRAALAISGNPWSPMLLTGLAATELALLAGVRLATVGS